MQHFRKLFGLSKCNVVGMIHAGALPGTPHYKESVDEIIQNACKDAEVYAKCGVQAVLVENMHDIPYVQPKHMGPEVTAMMTRICTEVRRLLPPAIHCGVQVLASGNREAVAVAQAAGLQFIRAEGFVFGHIADEGYIDANAGTLLRYRSQINGKNILIFTDIKKKHRYVQSQTQFVSAMLLSYIPFVHVDNAPRIVISHAVTSDVSLRETAKAAEFFLSDGVIITGSVTGDPVDTSEFKDIKDSVSIPTLIGSGVTSENICKYAEADALIIGTYFKKHGRWQNSVDFERVQDVMTKVSKIRNGELNKKLQEHKKHH